MVMELSNDCISMAMALDISVEGKVICDGNYPYNVLYANRAWTKITGYEQHEVMGRTLAILHGPRTDSLEIKQVTTLHICDVLLPPAFSHSKSF